jgi:tRNA(Ile)-lysidine synthase
MEKKVAKLACDYLKPNDTIVVAVSGGVDSVVLLDLLSKVNRNIIIAHVNHGIRKESDKEEVFVRGLAVKYNLPIEVRRLKLTKKTEEEARKKRYEFLRSVGAKNKAKYIATAHHLNDQAETVLLNLARGTGPLQVWGMKEAENDLFRPLLSFTKEEIVAYAKKERLKFVTDQSNKDVKYSRNKVRHQIVPKMIDLNSNFLNTLENEVRLGNELAETVAIYVKKAEKTARKENEIIISKLLKYPAFIQKEVLRRMLFKMTGKKEDIYSKNVNEILKLLVSKGTKKTKISRFTIAKIYDKIIFDFTPEKAKKSSKIELEKRIDFNGFVLSATIDKGAARKNNILLRPSLPYNLRVRTWRAGDRINSKAGTKKLQDVFSDTKVSVYDRAKWPVVVSGKEILWVPYLAASQKCLPKSNKALIIKVKDERKKI